MKASVEFIFFISFFVTALMTALTFLNYRRSQTRKFKHLTELWASLTLMVLANFIFRDQTRHMVALSMLGWLWPIKTISDFLTDLSTKILLTRDKYIVLGVGAFATLALASYGFSFKAYCAPFALAVGVVGLWQVYEAKREARSKGLTLLCQFTLGLFAIFFLMRLIFPVWRDDMLWTMSGFTVNLLVMIGLSISTLSLQIEALKLQHERETNTILRERTEQLMGQSKYSELGMMSAGIAHEINNPLAIIQAKVTYLLRIYRKPEKQQELLDGLQQILFTSERINKTIQGVREFIHQDENITVEEIKVKDLISDVLAFCGQRMKNHGVNLRFYGLENHVIKGHKIQLEQVLLNLMNNSFDAIEFLPDKWIEITAHDVGDRVQLYFKDSGPGIPPEVASHMMEPFFTTKAVGKGTGLGLVLARGIIEKHGGRFRLCE